MYYPHMHRKICLIQMIIWYSFIQRRHCSCNEKLKLKEDEDGNKVTDVRGIRAGCKVMKTRYAKPFEGVQVKIPYETGMNPYSGLVDLFEKKGLLVKDGNRLKYVTSNGTEHKEYRKNWDGSLLDTVMKDYTGNLIEDAIKDKLEYPKPTASRRNSIWKSNRLLIFGQYSRTI